MWFIVHVLKYKVPVWVMLLVCGTSIWLFNHFKTKEYYIPPYKDSVVEQPDTTALITQLSDYPSLTKTLEVYDTIVTFREVVDTTVYQYTDTLYIPKQVIVPDTVKILQDWTTARGYSISENDYNISLGVKYNRLYDVSVSEASNYHFQLGFASAFDGYIHPGVYLGARYGSYGASSSVIFKNPCIVGLNVYYEF